ncbi:MAG: hypothetical protein M0Q91_13400 [Methanoregula sp.]|jgi:hypothetical protein|nr:hypothetical protein [Methanoregula sp.]
MTGQWVASQRKNRRTGRHTVHFKAEAGKVLCGRKSERTTSADVNGPWNPDHPDTCPTCRSWYKLFFPAEIKPITPIAPLVDSNNP